MSQGELPLTDAEIAAFMRRLAKQVAREDYERETSKLGSRRDPAFQPRAYSPEDVADLWCCSPDHVRHLCRTGALPFFRLGGKLIRIKPADVERHEREHGRPSSSATDKESPAS